MAQKKDQKEPEPQLKFPDRESVDAAITEVRNKGETDWVCFGYEGNNTSAGKIVLEAKGSGGVNALTQALQEDHINYCLLRVVDVIDTHPTTKFVYITWIGPKVKFMQKAKISTHKGEATAFIGQAHVSITAENHSEMSHDVVMQKVQDASGTSDRRVAAGAPPVQTATTTTTTSSPSVSHAPAAEPKKATPTASPAKKLPTGQADAKAPEDKSLLLAVRSDSDSTDWALFGYEGDSNTIVPVGSGSGGIEELKQHLEEKKIFYGLLRVVDMFDATANVKFVFINWIGERVPITRKALITTHKGVVTNFIGQHHINFECSALSEVSREAIMIKVSHASGTASHILENAAGAGKVHLSGGI